MKLSQFNTSSLAEKVKYINSFIGHLTNKPPITSALVFEDYSILFVCSINGEILDASAEIHNQEQKADAMKLLEGKKVVAMDCSNLPLVKEEIMKKIFRGSNRLN